MALLICPRCGGKVSDKADLCPRGCLNIQQIKKILSEKNNIETDFEYIESCQNNGVIITKYKGSDKIVFVPELINCRPVVGLCGVYNDNKISIDINDGIFINNEYCEIRYVFDKCETVVISEGVKYIGLGTFSEIKNRSIMLPSTINCINSFNDNALLMSHLFINKDNVNYLEYKNDFPKVVSCKFNDDYCYTFDGLDITLLKYIGNEKNVKLPEKIDGENVTKIGSSCFANSEYIISIEFSKCITVIMNNAFENCKNLTEVYLTDTLEEIGSKSFINCKSLKKVMASNYLRRIGESAFEECIEFEKITNCNSLQYVEKRAFYNCLKLKEILFVENLKTISELTFYNCRNLENVKLNSNIKVIEGMAFCNCNSIKSIYIENNNVIIADKAFDYFDENSNLVIYCNENSTTHNYVKNRKVSYILNSFPQFLLYQGALQKYFGNQEILILPYFIKTIKYNTFDANKSIRKIILSKCVEKIDQGAFAKLANLEEIVIQDNSIYKSREDMLIENDEVLLWSPPNKLGKIEIPINIKIIGRKAFAFSESIESVKFPNTLKCINKEAFYSCRSLKDIFFENGIEEIENGAFCKCKKLGKVTLPMSIKKIGEESFDNCENLYFVTAKDSYISSYADRKNIKQIHSYFEIIANVLRKYNGDEDKVEIPNGVVTIKNQAFAYNKYVVSVFIPISVANIDNGAFAWCKNLKMIKIPSNVKNIGTDAFVRCENLLIICEENSYAMKYAKENNIKHQTSNLMFG